VPGNVLDRGAQLLNMVHSKRGDYRGDRMLDDIGGVVFPAMVGLENGRIYALFDESMEGYKRHELKIPRHMLRATAIIG